MATDRRNNLSYGMGEPLISMAPEPIVAQRAPIATDRAEIGTLWIDQPADDGYILTQVAANVSTWIGVGGGSGIFTGHVTAGTYITAATYVNSGTTMTVGTDLTVSGLGLGVVQSDAAGLFTSSAGTDGQLLIADTGGAPVWAAITSASLVLTPGAGTLNIEESGGTANSFVTDVGGPIAPLVGVTDVLGGANMSTDGTVANTITFNLTDDVTLVGGLTAGVDITMSTGDLLINADTDGAQTIYLHADGGVSETIEIHSDQGTGADSINVYSDVGGVTITSGLASADAINIDATDAGGGIDVDYGTGGMAIDGANGAFALVTGTGAIDLGVDAAAKTITIGNVTGATSVVVDAGTGAASFGASATAHTTTIGSVTGAASTVLQAGTGDLIMTSTDDITIDGAGVLELNSTAGAIGIGSDADAFAVNIATGAAARVVTIGNVTGATQLVLNSGTAGIQLASTGAGDITINSDDTLLLDSDGILELNSSAGIISIGNDADAFGINIGDGAAQRDIVIGNSTGTTSIALNAGTGALNIGTNAIAHVVTIGNVTGATGVAINSGTGSIALTSTGTGDITIDSDDTLLLDSDGVLELNSSGAAINIGNDADAFAVNISTGAAARDLTLGSTNTTSSTTVQSGTGGISLEAAGIVDVAAATDTQAAAACTVDANVGVATFTGLVTGAAATQVLTVTNSVCTVGSAILCTLASVGAEDALCTVEKVRPLAGSFTVAYQNNGAAALASDLILTFWILVA